MQPFLFAGPTLNRALALRPDLAVDRVTVLPPVKRGDLPRLQRAHQPAGVAVIADGLFHTALAVGHAEICDLLAGGWQVFGVSSMGAIRASEMYRLGMQGYGEVFRRYCQDDVDFRDDEVALLHDNEPPFRERSEPLLHLRHLVDHLVGESVISATEGAALIAELSHMWFGDRTLALVAARLSTPERREAIAAALRDIDRHRVKAHDLIGILDEQPWLTPSAGSAG